MGTDTEADMIDLRSIDATLALAVGGKAANLGELSRIEAVNVPAGFCVTTVPFRRVMATVAGFDDHLDRLSRLDPEDRESARDLSAALRRLIDCVVVPDDVATAIAAALARLGESAPVAVRSSATAEDAPTTSFAGQHDSYLNVVGPQEVVRHVVRCWVSLFSERAVAYRLRNGIDQRSAAMAVIVQRQVDPIAAGVLFSADPITSNRKIVSIEATFGLGEALVSGRVNPATVTVRDGRVVGRARQDQPVLRDEQAVELAELARRIETHFGRPQDIEWCLSPDGFHIVQSRPITTLFPIPTAVDGGNHVYVSVGHQQMMTDAMRPLGLAIWLLTALRPMVTAGGRLFVDVTEGLSSPAGRAALLEVMGRSDPLLRDALETVIERDDFVPLHVDAAQTWPPPGFSPPAPLPADPAIVTELINRTQASLAEARRKLQGVSGPALIDAIEADLIELKRSLADPLSMQAIMTGMGASAWLDDHLEEWLGERRAVDMLTRSAPNNITSEMGLALLDVADSIRPHPAVRAALSHACAVGDDAFLAGLEAIAGGSEAHDAICDYLERFGMRCLGEIDITRPRWSERPSTLLPLLLNHVESLPAGERRRRVEQGEQEARAKEQEVLDRLRALPDGDAKAEQTKQHIDLVRTYIGYREYPKYGMVNRYFLYKQALLAEATRLVEEQVVRKVDDVFFLTLQELAEVVRDHRVDQQLIERRRDELRLFETLRPPRVLTSEGEAINGRYRRDGAPAGALVGLAVSAGLVEGRARVITDLVDARVETGDILVTTHTDPSWAPLFIGVSGLVTEVGGLMTHGAVIAREYGLPAVVGVSQATTLINDGQMIRLDGERGYVEILPSSD